jgi:beta-galactosidase
MFVRIYSIIFFFILIIFLSSCSVSQKGRKQIDFNKGWRFILSDLPDAQRVTVDDRGWRTINVPHDWSIEGAFDEKNPAGVGGGALPGGTGWYRKTFSISADEKERLHFIAFDGVYRNSEVWINGHYLGKRPNGYIAFQYDITPYVNVGKTENVIAVKVDNSQQPNSRWYSGSGIYRKVRLFSTHKIRIPQWGTYISTPKVAKEAATVVIKTNVENSLPEDKPITLTTIFRDANKNIIHSAVTNGVIPKDSTMQFTQQMSVADPALWSVEHPQLYTAVSSIQVNGKVTDTYETTFGIRYFDFDSQKGFSLNGEFLKIKGACMHHDLGCLGAAVNLRAIERQMEIMKGMGVNAIRTSHNPPATELLEVCDRLGILVMDEAFDMWKKKKSQFDYHLAWDQWHKRDLSDQILRDRNHPSVFAWSIGNEIGEQWGADSSGIIIAKELAAIVRSLDPTRPVTTANNEVKPTNQIIASGALDLIGYNYNHKTFENFKNDYPGQKFIAAEATSALETRGHYDMPSDSIRVWPISWDKLFLEGNKDNTVSAYDNVHTPWGTSHEETWKIIKRNDFLSGMFIWTGFDYIGEPTPYVWPSRSSYFGVVDLAGFPKDVYYMYQSEWTKKPVLHIFPHWNWKENQVVDVWAYSNTDEVELFLNDKSLGIKKKQGEALHLMWRIPFSPGTLRAVARSDGKEILTKEIKTASKPAKVILEADRSALRANCDDLSFVTAKIVDDQGNLIPDADNLVTFHLKGNGFIAGVDNGNPVSHESFKGNTRMAFHGLCLAVIQGNDEGTLELKASSEGLESATVVIRVE